MKKYTFGFYPNNYLAEISVISETKAEAEALVREIIPDSVFDDGLFLNSEDDYN